MSPQDISTLVLHAAGILLMLAYSVKALVSSMTTAYTGIIKAQSDRIAVLELQVHVLMERVEACEEKWRSLEAIQEHP